MTFSVDLPLPPSVNGMFTARTFRGKGGVKVTGRGLSDEYKRWRDGAGIILNVVWVRAGRPKITGPWGWEMRFNVDHNSDISNRVKAIEDLLVKSKIVPGDQWVNEAHIFRDRSISLARVTVFALT